MNTRSSGRWWLVILIIIIIPILVGVMMSLRFFDWLPTSNDWIGFWGGYAGAVVGGIITLIVMRQTLKNSEDLQHKSEKRQLANHIAALVSDFCIEMMAYRSKWNYLYEQAQGREIDAEKKIEIGATTEIPRRIFFEVEILLDGIKQGESVVSEMQFLLKEASITRKTLSETETLLTNLRNITAKFVKEYTV